MTDYTRASQLEASRGVSPRRIRRSCGVIVGTKSFTVVTRHGSPLMVASMTEVLHG